MCTRFVYNGIDTIIGFNFDIDLSVWTHTVITEENRFYIGIKMPDGNYHSFHGINKNGNVGTLLYVHGNENAKYRIGKEYNTISELTESFIKGEISFDKALDIVEKKKIIYAPDATMQAMLSDKNGRVLIIEPGIGYKYEQENFSLITNYSVLSPETTKPYIVSGDTRYEIAKQLLEKYDEKFSVNDAFKVLKSVRQEGVWATRVSFVYSTLQNKVYYVLNNNFDIISEFQF
ncbi:MAG: conjugal transfer protein [Blautia sp.]